MLTGIFKVRWGEVAIYIAAAVGIMLGLRTLGTMLGISIGAYSAAALNAVFWVIWEMYQGYRDGKGINPLGDWGWQKRMEMILPVLAGFAVAVQ